MTELILIKNTLNNIEVKGEENMRMLLGCIQLLNKLTEEAREDGNNPQ